MSRRLFPLGTRLLGTFFLVVTAFVAARRLFSAGPDNVDLPDHNVDEPYYTYLEDGSILLTLQNGKTMRIEVRGKDEQEDTAKAYRHCDAKSGVPEALPFYSLRTAPSLVWNATFEDWLSSNGTVPIRLSWTSTEPEFVGLPGKLLADKLHYFNIRAPGVFTAYLKSETSIVPVFLRPRASEAERLYLSGAAPLVTGIASPRSNRGGPATNAWGGLLSDATAAISLDDLASETAPGSADENALNGGRGPKTLPYPPSQVDKGRGFEEPFPELSSDQIGHWEAAFFVPLADAGLGSPYTLYIRLLEPTAMIAEPWACSLAFAFSDDELSRRLEQSDLLRDMRDFCRVPEKTRKEYQARSSSFPGRQINVPFNASFVFQQQLQFASKDDLEDLGLNVGPIAEQMGPYPTALRSLHRFVYDSPLYPPPSQSAYRLPRSALSLGRWTLLQRPANFTKGHAGVHPNRTTCPKIFFDDDRRLVCETPNRPEWRFMPFVAESRHAWLFPAWLTKHCFWNYQPLLLGDSLAASLSEAMSCVMTIWPMTPHFFLGTVPAADAFAIKFFHPLFPDRGGRLPTFEEYLFHRNALPWSRKVRIVLWQLSIWPMSYTNSTLWHRGLDLLASFMARDKELYNVTSYIATATPPQPLVYDNGWMKTAGFSTRGRSQKWNWILRRVMRKWGVEVVDTWTPLEPRFDERADISHYCHRPFFDVAALIWPRICPE